MAANCLTAPDKVSTCLAPPGVGIREDTVVDGCAVIGKNTFCTFDVVFVCPSSSLSENLISDQSGDKLLEALSSCTHLEELK